MARNMTASIKYDLGVAAAVAGTSDVATIIFDMADYEAITFAGTVAVAAAGNFIQVEQNDVNSTSGMAALAGSKVLTDSTNDLGVVEIRNPRERYVRAVIKRGTSTATGDVIVTRQARVQPVTNAVTNEVKVVFLSAPLEGTP